MNVLSIFLTGLALSMDAFAVALTLGIKATNKDRKKIALKAALYFGGFQGAMPLLGWILGINFTQYIQKFDHWIAFGLLAIIGGKMIIDVIRDEEDEDKEQLASTSNKEFVLLAIATSIDALAVGIGFAFLKVNIIEAVLAIALTTFVVCFMAVFIGKKFGEILKSKAELFGGVILVVIGTSILLEHLHIY